MASAIEPTIVTIALDTTIIVICQEGIIAIGAVIVGVGALGGRTNVEEITGVMTAASLNRAFLVDSLEGAIPI